MAVLVFISLLLAGLHSAWVLTVYRRLPLFGVPTQGRAPTDGSTTETKTDPATGPPGVTVIKPVYGHDAELAANLKSWLEQRRPGPVQFIFSLQDPADAALPVIRRLCRYYPAADITVTVNSRIPYLSGKGSNLYHALGLAKYDLLIFSDSDTSAPTGFIHALLADMRPEELRLRAAVPVPRKPAGAGGAFMTLGIIMAVIVAWLSTVRLATPLRRQIGIPGGTIAITAAALTAVGGIKAFAGHITEDLKLGQLAHRHGLLVEAGPPIDLTIGRPPLSAFWDLMIRGHYGLMGLAPASFLLWLIVGFWYYLPAIAGLFAGRLDWTVLAALLVLGRTTVMAVFVAFMRRELIWTVLFYPAFEAIVLASYGWSLLSARRRRVTWRGITYRLVGDGSIAAPSTGRIPGSPQQGGAR
ncbi:MAG: glycosyltransferase [Thermaerobacterales bacterium]